MTRGLEPCKLEQHVEQLVLRNGGSRNSGRGENPKVYLQYLQKYTDQNLSFESKFLPSFALTYKTDGGSSSFVNSELFYSHSLVPLVSLRSTTPLFSYRDGPPGTEPSGPKFGASGPSLRYSEMFNRNCIFLLSCSGFRYTSYFVSIVFTQSFF